MYRPFLFSAACVAALFSNAQQYVHQVLVLNEGYYDVSAQSQVVPVTLGSYDPATGVYQTVATIDNARFGNHVAVDGDVVYVAADHRLLKFDANTFVLLAEADVPGIRRFDVWNDELVITLGEVGGLSHYCEVRDKHTLALEYTIGTDALPYSCEGVHVEGDKAYIAVNNGFDWSNTVGLIGVLDLNSQTLETSVDLGPDGRNPEMVFVEGDAVYAFNNKDFNGSSVSKMSIAGNALQYTHNVALSSGCASSAPVDHKLYFMEYAQNKLDRFDLTSGTVIDTLAASPATYGLIEDPIDHVMYGTTTDFFSTGTLLKLDLTGHELSSVAVGVSPGRLALDVRTSTGIATTGTIATFTVFPNPTTDLLEVSGAPAGAIVRVLDATGKQVLQVPTRATTRFQLDVSGLASGLYTVVTSNGGTARFTKR